MSVIYFFRSIAMELHVPRVGISILISTKTRHSFLRLWGEKKKDPCETRTQDPPFGTPTGYSLS